MRPEDMLKAWTVGERRKVMDALAEIPAVMAVAYAMALHDDLRKQRSEPAADDFRHACYGEALHAACAAKAAAMEQP